ncbi:hypothetical protein TNCV_607161 [Trichonephila clavipes]|nr:hypothetical protein TNCV_607161 [Trichonephila clavipes]
MTLSPVKSLEHSKTLHRYPYFSSLIIRQKNLDFPDEDELPPECPALLIRWGGQKRASDRFFERVASKFRECEEGRSSAECGGRDHEENFKILCNLHVDWAKSASGLPALEED